MSLRIYCSFKTSIFVLSNSFTCNTNTKIPLFEQNLESNYPTHGSSLEYIVRYI
jgi:hypothetical protein